MCRTVILPVFITSSEERADSEALRSIACEQGHPCHHQSVAERSLAFTTRLMEVPSMRLSIIIIRIQLGRRPSLIP